MSDIDWSKAPEGATHWEPDTGRATPSWMKLESGEWSYWPPEADKPGWVFIGSVVKDRARLMVPRPSAAWNGEWLPPVNTVCEYNANLYHEKGKELWCEVVIKYPSEWVIIFECTKAPQSHKESVGVELFGDISDRIEKRSRPIRTPGQIAADEREAAIEELRKLLSNVSCDDYHAAVAMIDAGYRKQADK